MKKLSALCALLVLFVFPMAGCDNFGEPENIVLNDPLAQALMDTWETELEFGNGNKTVTSGKLTPGMWIRPDNNTAFKIIPYVKELDNE